LLSERIRQHPLEIIPQGNWPLLEPSASQVLSSHEEELANENVSSEYEEHKFDFGLVVNSLGIPMEGNLFLNMSQGNIPEKMLLDDEFQVDLASDPGHTD